MVVLMVPKVLSLTPCPMRKGEQAAAMAAVPQAEAEALATSSRA